MMIKIIVVIIDGINNNNNYYNNYDSNDDFSSQFLVLYLFEKQKNCGFKTMERLSDRIAKPEENSKRIPEAPSNESKIAAAAASCPLESNTSIGQIKGEDVCPGEVDKLPFVALNKEYFHSKPLNHIKKLPELKSFVNEGLQNKRPGKVKPEEPEEPKEPLKEDIKIDSCNTRKETPENASNAKPVASNNLASNSSLTSYLDKSSRQSEDTVPQGTSSELKRDTESSQTHYSYLSICLSSSSNSVRGTSSSSDLTTRRNTPSARYPDEAPLRNSAQRPISQSRPSSPPPATYFPSPRRPSLSLPPSPQSVRVHRASLPANAFASFNVSTLRSNTASTYSSPSTSRARTPTPPPFNRRSPRRRSARTPSPRPPLPPQATNGPPAQPQQPPPNRNRQEGQPYKMKMRSR